MIADTSVEQDRCLFGTYSDASAFFWSSKSLGVSCMIGCRKCTHSLWLSRCLSSPLEPVPVSFRAALFLVVSVCLLATLHLVSTHISLNSSFLYIFSSKLHNCMHFCCYWFCMERPAEVRVITPGEIFIGVSRLPRPEELQSFEQLQGKQKWYFFSFSFLLFL